MSVKIDDKPVGGLVCGHANRVTCEPKQTLADRYLKKSSNYKIEAK